MTAATHPMPIRRTVIAAVLLALAIPLMQSRDPLAMVSRPLVVGVLGLLGLDAVDGGEHIRVGHLEVPWSGDCNGGNLLILLLALAVWVTRQEPIGWRYGMRLAAMLPAAIVANLLRVLTLIGYRAIAFPSVESPQTHYFIGFVWLIPFLALITPRDGRPLSRSLLETSHAAAVLALLAPVSGTPNGTLISLAAIVILSTSRAVEDPGGRRLFFAGGWALSGVAIALLHVESFWLPWLLLCPLLDAGGRIPRAAWLIGLACTHPLVAIHAWSWGLAAIGVFFAWRSRSLPVEWVAAAGNPGWKRFTIFAQPAWIACLAMPFLASSFAGAPQRNPWTPPTDVLSRTLGLEGYEVRLPGQSGNIGLACYPAPGSDRHHTVKVCLKYRGVDLVPSEERESVMTEGKHWYREFFLHEDALLRSYSAYVRKTFRPRADPGVHLIFVAPRGEIGAAEFDAACVSLAEDLYRRSRARDLALAEK